ncbi:MAG: site-2 protease family protein [Candidatus Velthaea sp.]
MMHDEPPSEVEGEYQPPQQARQPRGSGWRNAGGAAVALGLLAAKFKSLLFVLLSFKWIFLGGKFLLSFGSIFVSIWFYALAFGWKLGVVFVLLILVHEMGHWVVLRGFGVPVSLPYFIPGLGAFVTQKAMTANNLQDAAAAYAGPAVGIAASGLCHAYGIATGNPFWIVAAHIGYLLNLFNLIPVLPLDGGRIAGSIDPRLWMLGIVLFVAYMLWVGLNHPIAWFFLIIIGVSSIPRAIAAWRGVVDQRVIETPTAVRGGIALFYFGAIAVAAVAAAATNIRV